ncbi:MAG: COX15/CtaA family protein, partial [Candidatus Kariarchaeaceae archaeon]
MTVVSDNYRRMTYMLVITTYILILMGGYVKAIGAGLACPDWPLCYDKFLPNFGEESTAYDSEQVFAEWFHRLWAGLNGLFMLGIAIKAWGYRSELPTLSNLGILGVILYTTQVIFGWLTVTSKINEIVVVAHLGNAVAIVMIQMSIAFVSTVNS